MKSARYLGKGEIAIAEVPIPETGPHDVLVQNIYSSICGTDVAVYQHGPGTGHRIAVGGEFGHETISCVVKAGQQITEFQVGQRVYPYPRYARGDTKQAGTIGGFSEYILIPNARLNHSLYFVPDQITDKTACLIKPFTVGTRAARRSRPKPSENAVVFGGGTIGIAAATALKWFGLKKIMVCDISGFRLSKARALGFEVCNISSDPFIQNAVSCFGAAPSLLGETADIDIFIDAAGHESILKQFMEYGKIESRFVSVAVNAAVRNLDLLHLTYSQQSIIGSGGYTPEDVRDVLAMMESGKFDIESIITHEYAIDQLEEALQMAANVDESLNVVINFSV